MINSLYQTRSLNLRPDFYRIARKIPSKTEQEDDP